jgi:hypothetical protein
MKDYNQISIYEINQDMKTFFYAKEFDLVKYLLTSPDLKHHADINFSHDFLFEHASMYGYTDLIKFILETPTLNRTKSLKDSCISGMHYAVEKGHLDTIQYFEAKLNENNDNISHQYLLLLTQQACVHGQLNVFKHLAEKYLENHSFKDKDYKAFSKTFKKPYLDLIQYLIFELNIPKAHILMKC